MGLALAILILLQIAPEDIAVRKAVEVIKTANLGEHRELALWTLVDVGVRDSNPRVRDLLQDVLSKPIETTKSAALQAMILERLDGVTHQARIAHCAQFLIDNQAKDGRWGAGKAVEPPAVHIQPPPKPKPPPGRNFGGAGRPIPPKVSLTRRDEGPETGDAGNSLWAAHGIQACHFAGIRFPPELSPLAERAWRKEEADPADGVAGLSIHLYFQDKPHKTDPDVLRALERLGSLARSTDPHSLAALKRAMFLYDSETLAGRKWWPEGVKVLLESQRPDGSWGGIEDTCAAARYLYILRYSGIPADRER